MNVIKVKTIAAKHLSQLTVEHYWEGEFDWSTVKIIGRLANNGFILCNSERGLRLISPISFQDWQLEQNGCRKRVNGKWEYAPTPHTEYSRKAKESYNAIPQIFED